MDEDALAFLEKWIEDNVAPIDASLRAEKAESLAEQFYRDAAEAGFAEEDLEEVIAELAEGDDLASYIEAALLKAEDDETDDET